MFLWDFLLAHLFHVLGPTCKLTYMVFVLFVSDLFHLAECPLGLPMLS